MAVITLNDYLTADPNWNALLTHNPDMKLETARTAGQYTITKRGVNPDEVQKGLQALSADPAVASKTVDSIAIDLFGSDDPVFQREVARHLKYGSPFNNKLVDGTAIVARSDGTLRITGTPEEYADLTDEEAARLVAREKKLSGNRIKALGRTLDKAAEKVPGQSSRFETTRQEAGQVLGSHFTRQLALLAGGDE